LERGKEKDGEVLRGLFVGLLGREGTRGRVVTLTADEVGESGDGDEKKS